MADYLTVSDHNRVFNDFQYVYPVLSRRAGGVSLGINLNVNNACNWRCIYCQVPDLKRGGPLPINLAQLEHELRVSLHDILHGTFMQSHVDAAHSVFKDIAFSGNGEPTSAPELGQVIACLEQVLIDFELLGKIKIRLITNGSLINRPNVSQAIKHLAKLNGEVWFKLDAGTSKDIKRINDIHVEVDQQIARLKRCAGFCPTYVQTCLFAYQEHIPSKAQIAAYLACLRLVKPDIMGVMLYGVARPSFQPEANDITRLPLAFFESVAEEIRNLGLTVSVSE